jgi:hypothetical protein
VKGQSSSLQPHPAVPTEVFGAKRDRLDAAGPAIRRGSGPRSRRPRPVGLGQLTNKRGTASKSLHLRSPRPPAPVTSASTVSDYLGAFLSALHTPGTKTAMTKAPAEPMTGPAAPMLCASTAEATRLMTIITT